MPPRNYILTKKKWNKFLVNLDFWILNFNILYKKTEELKYKLRISNSCRKTGTSKKKKRNLLDETQETPMLQKCWVEINDESRQTCHVGGQIMLRLSFRLQRLQWCYHSSKRNSSNNYSWWLSKCTGSGRSKYHIFLQKLFFFYILLHTKFFIYSSFIYFNNT